MKVLTRRFLLYIAHVRERGKVFQQEKKGKRKMKTRKNEKQQVTIFVLEESHQWVYIRTYRATRTKSAELYNRISRSQRITRTTTKTFYQGKERSL